MPHFTSREQAIDAARTAMGDGAIFICHGEQRCERDPEKDVPFTPCRWCYELAFGDPRTTEVIVEDIDRIQIGH